MDIRDVKTMTNGIVKHDQELMKKINKEMVLNLIRERGPISRAELARISNMSSTSISRIVSEFSELGMVKETTVKSNGVGRKAILLDIDPSSIYVIGIEIDHYVTKVSLVDFDGIIGTTQYINYDSHAVSYESVLNIVCDAVEGILSRHNYVKSKVIGIGIGVPGIIDTKKGTVVFSPQLGWKDVNVVSYFEEKIGFKTTIENVIKSRALAESVHGSTKGYKRTALINFGTGVGSALIVNEEIYRGITNSAGEIGHTTVDPNGRLCECGRLGCLQTYISEETLIQEAKIFKKLSNVKEIFDSAKSEEKWAITLLDRAYTYMGIAVCNVICMYNPDTVIISGKLIEESSETIDIIMEKVHKLIWDPFKNTYKIKGSNLGENAGILGVATLVMNNYIDIEM